MREATQSGRVYRFGQFTLNPAERLLLCDGKPVGLTPKAFDLLLVLVENPGRLLGKDSLLQEVWPGTFVEEANLSNNISVLRRVLTAQGSDRPYIETVPRHGYRFVVPVSVETHAAHETPATPPATVDTE